MIGITDGTLNFGPFFLASVYWILFLLIYWKKQCHLNKCKVVYVANSMYSSLFYLPQCSSVNYKKYQDFAEIGSKFCAVRPIFVGSGDVVKFM